MSISYFDNEAAAIAERKALYAAQRAARAADEAARVLHHAHIAIVATLDLQIKLGLINALAEQGDIDKAFSRWCDAKPKSLALARLAGLETAARNVLNRGEVAVDFRRIELTDAVISTAAAALRLEFLEAAERVN